MLNISDPVGQGIVASLAHLDLAIGAAEFP
jgi:hypothetical protein